MPPRLRKIPVLRALITGVLLLGSAAITAGSLGYFDPDEQAPFVIEKLPLPHEELWLFALKVHVVAAAWCLPACVLLLSRTLLRRAPRVHRWLGRFTGLALLFALAPSGFYLSLFAKGGLASTAGFLLSGLIVVAATVHGVRTARAGDFVAHRRAMLHVLAQLSVAVSSRALLFLFDAADFHPEAAYLVSLWVPVLASAAAVELFTSRRTTPRSAHEPLAHPRPAARDHAAALGLARG